MNGLLILSLDAVLTAPKFFSVLALVLRAVGFEVLLLKAPTRGHIDVILQDIELPVTRIETRTIEGVRACLGAYHPIIWVDLDFFLDEWPPDDRVVTLNWNAVLQKKWGGPLTEKV